MNLKRIWKYYKRLITKNCTDPNSESTKLVYWQNKLFAASIIYIFPLTFIAIIPGAYMAYQAGFWGMIAVDIIAIATVIIVGFVPGVPVFERKLLFNGMLYLTSLMLLLYLGLMGPGLLYLLAITIFIALSLDKKYGYLAVGINVLICIGIAFWIYTGEDSFGIAADQSLGSWIAVSSNLVILSAAAVLLIPILFESLQSALVQEKKLRSDIENDQRWLRLLESAIENTSESIAILDTNSSNGNGRKILYVNDAFEEMTGYYRGEVIGNSFNKFNGPKTSAKEQNKLQSALEDWRPYETEFINYRKDGSEYWTHVSFAPVMNANYSYSHWVVVAHDVTNRKERESELRDSLQEKETLLMEIHHRVKNNLAVISGMMQLQAFESKNPELQEKLFDSVFRISTMATVHEMLYQTNSFSNIDFTQTVETLVNNVSNMLESGTNVNIQIDSVPIRLNINQAIPVSLIVNEVITNVYKHAFKNRKSGLIEIKLHESEDQIVLKISDNGMGLPEDFDKNDLSSMGMKLINVLSEQIDANYDYHSLDKGTRFTISFLKAEIKGGGNLFMT